MDKVNRVAISPDGNKTVSASYGKSELEKKFIVVNWDQRGSGKSYDRNIDPNTMTIDQLVNDGLEVTKILLRNFGKSKIYLVGTFMGHYIGHENDCERFGTVLFIYRDITTYIKFLIL